ncbi:MAG: hypothetical protein ACTSWI_00135 [Alphaproteobacteria bacterium]
MSRTKYSAEREDLPLIKGGQGRESWEIERDAIITIEAMALAVIAGLVGTLIGAVVGWISRG